MAQQIKVIDTQLNEHYIFAKENGIFFSKDNDGRYKQSLFEYYIKNDLSLDDIIEIIEERDYTKKDLNLDDSFMDDVDLSEYDLSDICEELEYRLSYQFDKVKKYLSGVGYTLTKNE